MTLKSGKNKVDESTKDFHETFVKVMAAKIDESTKDIHENLLGKHIADTMQEELLEILRSI